MRSHREAKRSTDARRGADDGGYVLVLAALLLVPMLAAVAFAVDVGSWYVRGSSAHKAADAAALAGVIWLPDMATAQSVAIQAAARNGFDDADPDVTVSVVQSGPAELEVTITQNDVPLYFAGLFVNDVDISKSATAEFVGAVPMGSPENFLGNDPLLGETPNLWLAVFGNATNKTSGDRYHTVPCGGVFCTGGVNDEFEEDGYYFVVENQSSSGPLNIELFDPVHHDYGDHCGVGWLYDDGDVAAQPWYSGDPGGLGSYDEDRYEKGGSGNPGGAAWCPGDNGLAGTNYEMTVIVRRPDNTPLDPSNNPVECWVRYGNDVPSSQADFATKLQDPAGAQPVASGGLGSPAPSSVAFNDYFREWAPVCSIGSPIVGDYIVQIRTNASTINPTLADPTIWTQGRNRFSMRAGKGAAGGPGWSSGVSLYAYGKLPMFVNRPGGDGVPTAFYIARVLPQYAGQTLQLDLYDLTDGSDLSVAFSPPADSNYAQFTNCDMSMITSGGSFPLTSSNCAASHLSEPRLESGQGHAAAIAASIDVPLDYTCDTTTIFGCWVTVEMTFDGNPSDTTTWSATLTGDPIRLVD